MYIRIDEEFRGLIPPLTPEELAGLEASLIADGCRDALVKWGPENLLLDGHNRKEICDRLGIDYRVVALELPDRDACKCWIIANQLSRRNVPPHVAAFLRGMRYNLEKKAVGSHNGNQHTKLELAHSEPIPTAERIAKETGVSAATVKRDGQFAEAVESLKEAVPDIQERVMAGDIQSKKAVIEAAAEPERAADILSAEKREKIPPPGPPCWGIRFAEMAIMDLEKIADDDIERGQAFQLIRRWIEDHE